MKSFQVTSSDGEYQSPKGTNENATTPSERRTVGLVVPPKHGDTPADAPLVYPAIQFHTAGLGLERMDQTGYEEATTHIVEQSLNLTKRGVSSIGIMGTSLTFFRGVEGNSSIESAVRKATGLPVVTMSSGLVAGLRAVGSSRPVLASAYSQEVHSQLDNYLGEEGFTPHSGSRLGIVSLNDLEHIGPYEVARLGLEAWEKANGAGDCLVLSCGGFRSRGAMLLLEEALGIPVISSAVAGLWATVNAAGFDPRVPSHGELLSSRPRVDGKKLSSILDKSG